VLVVDFVCLSNGHEIGVFRPPKPLEPLMYEHIMHEEICQAVGSNACAYPHAKIAASHGSSDETPSTWNGEDQKEGIIFLEKARFMHVVIRVEKPHGTVHEVFVRKPRNPLHPNEGTNYYAC
jgi:hypothetical protein